IHLTVARIVYDQENKQTNEYQMATPPPPDYAAEMEQLRVQLAELHEQQENVQTTNNLLEQLVQKLDCGKKGKIWVDKPERFNGKIGDSVENWLTGWER